MASTDCVSVCQISRERSKAGSPLELSTPGCHQHACDSELHAESALFDQARRFVSAAHFAFDCCFFRKHAFSPFHKHAFFSNILFPCDRTCQASLATVKAMKHHVGISFVSQQCKTVHQAVGMCPAVMSCMAQVSAVSQRYNQRYAPAFICYFPALSLSRVCCMCALHMCACIDELVACQIL